MASLTVRNPDGSTRTVNLLKRLTSIGRGTDNDIALNDSAVPDSALHIMFDGARYQVGGTVEFTVNGKKRVEHVLNSSDTIRIGASELTFGAAAAPTASPALARSASDSVNPDEGTVEVGGGPNRDLTQLRRLTAFSERLLQSYAVEQILEALMDEVIELTRADKGFLILMESELLRVKVARNLPRENIEDAIERVCDSIVAKVVAPRSR